MTHKGSTNIFKLNLRNNKYEIDIKGVHTLPKSELESGRDTKTFQV